MPPDETRQDFSQIRVVDIHPGDVDRYVDAGIALPVPFLEQSADPLPDILVQLGDKAAALKNGDELPRRLQAPSGGSSAPAPRPPPAGRPGAGTWAVSRPQTAPWPGPFPCRP